MGTLQAIIFDCFGVIYTDVSEAYFAHFPDKHEQLRQINKAADHGFINQDEYWRSVSEITGDAPETIKKAMLEGHTANKALLDFIQSELKPHYKIGMLSNVGQGWIQHFFDEHQLHELFDTVVLSSEVGISKPEREVFKITAERLGVEPEHCLMIDDRQENCHGAETAGMQSIWYENFADTKRQLLERLKK